MDVREVNFDGLVGPTHNYAGLSPGNIASRSNAGTLSRPRDAALQGLAKMRFLVGMGLNQGVLPPQERPDLACLRRLGFSGSDSQIIEKAAAEPALLAGVYSASAMWTANAATVAPSAETADGRLHLVPANLASTFHRSLEPEATARALRRCFASDDHFVVHDALPPGGGLLGDEGAANHTRLARMDGTGVHIFVYGRSALGGDQPAPTRYPARQTLEASQAVARLAGLSPDRCCFIQQAPEAIDAGVFHNDVISVGDGPVLLFHERAFADSAGAMDRIDQAMGGQLVRVPVRESEVTLDVAVRTYLFNSQLVAVPGVGRALVAPVECEESDGTRNFIEGLVADPAVPITFVCYLDVRQSMSNGGGPACLRLRVALSDEERAAVRPAFLLDEERIDTLSAWVERHYREELAPDDLADPALLTEVRTALDELTGLLDLGTDFYPFQRTP